MGKAIAILGAMLACNIVLTIHQTLQVKQFKEKTVEQLEELKAALNVISGELDKVSSDTDSLIAKLEAVNTDPAVDLTEVLGIKDRITALDAKVDDAPIATDTPAA